MENTGIVNDIVNEIVTCGRVFRYVEILVRGLPLTVIPRDLFRRWIDHDGGVRQQPCNKRRLTTTRRSSDDARERMLPAWIHVNK